MKTHCYLIVVLLLSGCYEIGNRQDVIVQGFIPVYGIDAQAEIRLLPSQSLRNPGKIYIYGNFLLINEVNKGIHIFDNTDPANPEAVGFAEIIGNTDMAMKDDVLYVDHMGTLVALSTHNFKSLEKLGSLSISTWIYGIPPPAGNYFECIDQARGLVVGWKIASLKNPECYAYDSFGPVLPD